MAKPRVIIQNAGLRSLIRVAASRGSHPRLRRAYRQWAARYSAFVRRRFVAQGDGSWAPLKPSTIKQRRGGTRRARRGGGTTTRGSAGRVAILRDTGTLLNALGVRQYGNVTRRLRNGVRFGFARAAHPGGGDIRTIAVAHDEGAPARNLPQREILVKPSKQVIAGMIADLRRAIF